jgi:catechol 2,3-dioxygenase-like lactoylglutathione lyase family enzyme
MRSSVSESIMILPSRPATSSVGVAEGPLLVGTANEDRAAMSDEQGIWTMPGSDLIASFHDPDRNVLSLTQHVHAVARVREIVPIFPVQSVAAALARYERLGFTTNAYDDTYGFARRNSVHIHVSLAVDWDPLTSDCMAYLYVEDADAIHAEWSSVEGRHHPPTDTPYGLREGAYVDPDGNLLRYGSFLT